MSHLTLALAVWYTYDLSHLLLIEEKAEIQRGLNNLCKVIKCKVSVID